MISPKINFLRSQNGKTYELYNYSIYSHIFDVNVTPVKKGDEEEDVTEDTSDNDIS